MERVCNGRVTVERKTCEVGVRGKGEGRGEGEGQEYAITSGYSGYNGYGGYSGYRGIRH